MRAPAFVLVLVLVLAGACATTRAAPDWDGVRAELARRVALDQELRGQLGRGNEIDPEVAHRLAEVDGENTAWMKDLVARHGWPTNAHVGPEGANHAWLLVQHADHDVDFQEHCLALLGAAVAAGEAEGKQLAYLHDRVALRRGRPQRYGTQFLQRGGTLEPYELEDAGRVDEWRAQVGLGTLAEYRARLEGR